MGKFLTYDIKNGTHRSAEAEWAPHQPKGLKFFEWQYFTAPLMGDNGHRYFLLYCVFNFGGTLYRKALQSSGETVSKDKIPMVSIVHICDYDGNVYKTSNGINMVSPEKLFDEKTGILHVVSDNEKSEDYKAEFGFKGDKVTLASKVLCSCKGRMQRCSLIHDLSANCDGRAFCIYS